MSPTKPDLPPPDWSESRRRWACQVLRLDEDTPPDALRTRVLERLEQTNFVPPEPWHDAVAVLLAGDAAAPRIGAEAFGDALEQWLRQLVENFTAGFFDLPCDQRRRDWEALTPRCARSPQLSARLGALEPALDVDLSTLDQEEDALVARLGRRACGLFAARPGMQATLRRQFMQEIRNDRTANWPNAVRALRARHPRIAEVGAGLLDRIAALERSRPTMPPNRKDGLTKNERRAPSTGKSEGGGLAVWLVIFVLIGLGRLATTTGTGRSSPRPYTPSTPPRIDQELLEQLRRRPLAPPYGPLTESPRTERIPARPRFSNDGLPLLVEDEDFDVVIEEGKIVVRRRNREDRDSANRLQNLESAPFEREATDDPVPAPESRESQPPSELPTIPENEPEPPADLPALPQAESSGPCRAPPSLARLPTLRPRKERVG